MVPMAVAGPRFDLGVGACTLSGSGGRKSLKVLTVEIKFIFSMFGPISIKGRLKMKRERKKERTFSVWGIKDHSSAAVGGSACERGTLFWSTISCLTMMNGEFKNSIELTNNMLNVCIFLASNSYFNRYIENLM